MGIADGEIFLSALDGTTGSQFSGETANDRAGYSVAGAGDVNGDGIDDFIIGAPLSDPSGTSSGSAYVVFGSSDGFGTNLNLSALDGTNGFQINGEVFTGRLGESVSSAGDLNGDGFDDVMVGAPYFGRAYVIYGKGSGFADTLQVSALNGADGFELVREAVYDNGACSVSLAGDVNGDGIDDILIGARENDANGFNSGAAYVVFGTTSGFSASLSLSALDGSNGFKISGVDESDYAGGSVSSAGDVNGDGFGDLIIGAVGANPGDLGAGAAYVVFGHSGAFGANLNLSTLNGSNGFRITGAAQVDYAGSAVSSAGDVNGDGFDDLLVSATGADANGTDAGAVYVIFGKTSGFTSSLAVSGLDGTNGFRIIGESGYSFAGKSVSTAGDFNGDGFDDILIGAPGEPTAGNYSDAAYVVYGHSSGFGASVDLSLLDGTNGFRINGEMTTNGAAGISVSAAGDVNGDGFADILVGDPRADTTTSPFGAAYLLYGFGTLSPTEDELITGTPNDETLEGNAGNDTIIGGGGNDVLDGGTGNDILDLAGSSDGRLLGGEGDDLFLTAQTAGRISGGMGRDVLRTVASTDLSAVSISQVEVLETAGAVVTAGIAQFEAFRKITYRDLPAFDSTPSDLALSDGGTINLAEELGTLRTSIQASAFGNAITTGRGNDRLYGGLGSDVLAGGLGDDRLISGQAANDTLLGGEGADLLSDAGGDDVLDGGAGRDSLRARGGADTLIGGVDNDVLSLRQASEGSLFGGGGDDLVSTSQTLGLVDGGAGNDTLEAAGTGTQWLGELAMSEFEVLATADATVWATVAQFEAFQSISRLGDVSNPSGMAQLKLADGGLMDLSMELWLQSAQIAASSLGNQIISSRGNDRLLGGLSADQLDGAAGDDTLRDEELGNDSLFGGLGDDLLVDMGGVDLMDGQEGNDALSATGGADQIFGGSGNDIIRGTLLAGATILGGTGGDSVELFGGWASVSGGSGNDSLYGGAGNDSLSGNLGDDDLRGGNGDDLIEDQSGNDRISGGGGADVIDLSGGNDTVDTGGGNDRIDARGMAGFALDAGADNDRVSLGFAPAATGNGTINGGSGFDILYLAGGNLTSAGVVTGFEMLETRGQTVRLTAGQVAQFQSILQDANTPAANLRVAIDLVGGGIADLSSVVGAGGVDLRVTASAPGGTGPSATITAGIGDDSITALSGNDSLTGGAGDDTILGGGGIDWIDGGQGNDRLILGMDGGTVIGGLCDDTIIGGDGADHLSGGDGNDLLTVNPNGFAGVLDTASGGSGIDTIALKGLRPDYAFVGTVVDFTASYTGAGSGGNAALSGFEYVRFDDQTVTVAALFPATNRAPVITSNGGGAAAAVSSPENISVILSVIATDADANSVIFYSVAGGADAARFAIDPATGELRFLLPPNFEAPSDRGADNSYEVIVRASDGAAFDEQTLTVTVTDGAGVTINGSPNSDVIDTATTVLGQPLATDEADLIFGGAGNDRLDGGPSSGGFDPPDTLVGGTGNDLYVVRGPTVIVENPGEGFDTVNSAVSYTLGAEIENLTLTGTANIDGTGNSTNNVLIGNAGNNTIDGRAGVDRMEGGLGDDTYIVSELGDSAFEEVSAGNDTVRASITYALNGNIETLVLTGSRHLNGTGNNLNNVISGNSGNNFLSGGSGADTLVGGIGNDTYGIDRIDDVIIELAGQGDDLVESNVSYSLAGTAIENLTLSVFSPALNATGNSAANRLLGNANDNVLDGGGGQDTMDGGQGNDTYVTDGDDVIIDAFGTDLVLSSASFTLASTLENLTLTGSADLNGTGNVATNRLTGNRGNNLLDGAGGADTLAGGRGDDVYVVDSADTVIEAASEGRDRVESAGNFQLGANLEDLVLTTGQTGTGNALANAISGNDAGNWLDGRLGQDTLAGGGGIDRFIFSTALDGGNADVITDFNATFDQIALSATIFSALSPGVLGSTAFAANTSGEAGRASDRIIYHATTGQLYYDSDGTGGIQKVLFATMTAGLTLSAVDFEVF